MLFKENKALENARIFGISIMPVKQQFIAGLSFGIAIGIAVGTLLARLFG